MSDPSSPPPDPTAPTRPAGAPRFVSPAPPAPPEVTPETLGTPKPAPAPIFQPHTLEAQEATEPTDRDARPSDLAAYVLLVGFLVSFGFAGVTTHVVDGSFSHFEDFDFPIVILGGFWPAMIAFASGLIVVFDPPGKASVVCTKIAAWLTIASPFLYGIWIGARESAPRSEEIIEATIRSAFGSSTVLAIAALVTLRQRREAHRSPYLIVGALIFANFFNLLLEFDSQADESDLSDLAFGLLTKAGSPILLFALILVLLHGSSRQMGRLLRFSAMCAGAAAIVGGVYAVLEHDGRALNGSLLSLPQSLLIISLVVALTLIVEPSDAARSREARGHLGATVLATVLFWPLGIVALTAAMNATAAAEIDDRSGVVGYEEKANKWRNATFGVFGALFVFALVRS